MNKIKLVSYQIALLVGLQVSIFATFANAQSAAAWISDEIEAPLRKSPDINAAIIELLSAGQRVTVIKTQGDYSQIKTASGQQGWLSNYYLLNSESVHARFEPMQKAYAEMTAKLTALNEKIKRQNKQIKTLQAQANVHQDSLNNVKKLSDDNQVLQKKLNEQSAQLSQLAKELNKAKRAASDAKTRYVSLKKVSQNAVEIDSKNQVLQEKLVKLEQTSQQLTAENQSLKSSHTRTQTITGALIVFGGVFVGYLLSVLMPPRGRRKIEKYPSSSFG